MEARGASGEMVGKEHAEIITAGSWMIPTFLAAAVLGVIIVTASATLTSGWVRVLLVVLGGLTGLVAIASIGFAVWGKYLGFPWHFTP